MTRSGKHVLFAFIWLCVAADGLAGRPPGHASLDSIALTAKYVFIGRIESASQSTNKDKDSILQLTVELTESVVGDLPADKSLKCRYEEYAPKFPSNPDFMPCFVDYTGSGIEFNVKKGETYIFLLASLPGDKTEAKLLRVEPVGKKDEILAIRRKAQEAEKDKREPPATGDADKARH